MDKVDEILQKGFRVVRTPSSVSSVTSSVAENQLVEAAKVLAEAEEMKTIAIPEETIHECNESDSEMELELDVVTVEVIPNPVQQSSLQMFDEETSLDEISQSQPMMRRKTAKSVAGARMMTRSQANVDQGHRPMNISLEDTPPPPVPPTPSSSSSVRCYSGVLDPSRIDASPVPPTPSSSSSSVRCYFGVLDPSRIATPCAQNRQSAMAQLFATYGSENESEEESPVSSTASTEVMVTFADETSVLQKLPSVRNYVDTNEAVAEAIPVLERSDSDNEPLATKFPTPTTTCATQASNYQSQPTLAPTDEPSPEVVLRRGSRVSRSKRTSLDIQCQINAKRKSFCEAVVGLPGLQARPKPKTTNLEHLQILILINTPVELIEQLLREEVKLGKFTYEKGFFSGGKFGTFEREKEFWHIFLRQMKCLPNMRVSTKFWGNYFGIHTTKIRKENTKVGVHLDNSATVFQREMSTLWKEIPPTYADKYVIFMITSQVKRVVTDINSDTKHAAAFVARWSDAGVKYYYYETMPFNPFAPMGFVGTMTNMAHTKELQVIFPKKTVSQQCFHEVITFIGNAMAGNVNFDAEFPIYKLGESKGGALPLIMKHTED